MTLDHKVPPPIVAAIVALAMWLAAPIGPAWAAGPGLKTAVVVLLVIAGLAFDLLGLIAFRRAKTTVNPLAPQKASALVTGGIYRITRNPMYVGMSLLLLAWAAHLSALLAFAGPFVFVLYITRFQIQPEERVLLERFGEAYADYAGRVRRWL